MTCVPEGRRVLRAGVGSWLEEKKDGRAASVDGGRGGAGQR